MIPGPLLFARYGYPPNQLGYCGPSDHRAVLEYGASSTYDQGLIELVTSFEGAMPYLELIARSCGRNSLDADVVRAYWVGNRLLERVDPTLFKKMLDERFRKASGRGWDTALDVASGCFPHHNFHVFAIYPWVGLLRGGWGSEPLEVLDRCRIASGRVEQIVGNSALVATRPLQWDGIELSIGAETMRSVTWRQEGYAQVWPKPGDLVSLHWDRVCDVLDPGSVLELDSRTRKIMTRVNTSMRSEVKVPAALS